MSPDEVASDKVRVEHSQSAPAKSIQRGDRDADAVAHVHGVIARSDSSFYGAMRLLPEPRREAMFAIYAFCREVDDLADDPLPMAEKAARLAGWRAEIDRLYAGDPTTPTARALLGPVHDYGLQRQDFLAVIDGMEMDANESMRGPPMATLELYCQRVAGAVGLLSIRAFGAEEARARDVAWSLGHALQLTNILRDLREDADRGRLYLPAELLDRHGIGARDPGKVLSHPHLPKVCDDLATIAKRRFTEAQTAMADCSTEAMRPALVMMHIYRRILGSLLRRGWTRLDEPVRVPKPIKLWIALRYGLL